MDGRREKHKINKVYVIKWVIIEKHIKLNIIYEYIHLF